MVRTIFICYDVSKSLENFLSQSSWPVSQGLTLNTYIYLSIFSSTPSRFYDLQSFCLTSSYLDLGNILVREMSVELRFSNILTP